MGGTGLQTGWSSQAPAEGALLDPWFLLELEAAILLAVREARPGRQLPFRCPLLDSSQELC